MKAFRLLPCIFAGYLVSLTGISLAAQANFGSVNVGSNASVAVTVTILNAGTLGSISVTTQGAANLDFNGASGGTCTAGTAYSANASCTVNVTFTPKATGARYGGVVLYDAAGAAMGTQYLQGLGTGPQVNFLPGTETLIGSNWNFPDCCLVDESGNVYIENQSVNYKETPSAGGYVQSTMNINGRSGGFAIDGAGTLYMSVGGPSIYVEAPLAGGGYAESTVGSGLSAQNGAAVDGAGNVYISDALGGQVLKETLSAGQYTESVIYTCGIVGQQSCPSSVTVDASGNVFITAYDASQVVELTPSAGGYTQSMIGSGLVWPSSIVADGNGNLIIADTLNSRIVKETLYEGSYVQSTVSSSALYWPWGANPDSDGNVYIDDNYHARVLKEDVSDPPSLSFATTMVGATSSNSPQTVTIENNGNAPLNFSAVTFPTDFPEASKADCKAGTSLPAGGTCTLTIDFTPVSNSTSGSATVALTENVTLTTNNLNAASTQQSIAVSGTETFLLAATPTLTPAGGTFNSSQSVTVSESTAGASIYYTTDGTTPTASSTLYSGAITVSNSETIEAIAVASGYANSAVASAAYIINLPPNFALAVSQPSLSVPYGQSGEVTISVTPQNGFASATTFTCSGLPTGGSCSFAPASVTPSGTVATSTLTVSSSTNVGALHRRSDPWLPAEIPGATVALAFCCFGWKKRRGAKLWLLVTATASLGTALLIGCGGSSTPAPATSTVTVTATSGAIQHSAQFSLTIQ